MSSSQTVSKPTEGQRPSGMRTFVAIFLILHVPLFIYPVLRLCNWLEAGPLVTVLILVPVAISQVVSRWWLRGAKSFFAKKIRQVADFLLGVSPIVIMALLVAEVLVFAGVVSAGYAAWSVIGATLLVSLLGLANAMYPVVRRFSLQAKRLKQPVRFVQITDVHIGSRSHSFLERVVDRIIALDPDFLCITGDFVDAWGVSEHDLSSLKRLECPVYFTIGNHERYEDLDRILERLDNLGVTILRNRCTPFRDDIQVIGIDDRDDALQVQRELAKMSLDGDRFTLLLYHRPRGLEAAGKKGVDLMLSGHTHNGQIFPFHFAVKNVFERIAGMYELGGARLFVSQGTGTWGPVMRVGTRSEITLFEMEPNQ